MKEMAITSAAISEMRCLVLPEWNMTQRAMKICSDLAIGTEIEKLNNQQYLLYINSADNQKQEIALARKLGIFRSLLSYSVLVEFEPADDDHFVFDFREIVLRLIDKGEICPITGDGLHLATSFMEGTTLNNEEVTMTLYHDNFITLSVRMGCVGQRFITDPNDKDKMVDTWEMNGAEIRGLLVKVPGDERKYRKPSLLFTITNYHLHVSGWPLPFDTSMEDSAASLANAVMRAMDK